MKQIDSCTFALLLGLAGCGTGGAADALRPDSPKASDALGEEAKCHDVKGGAEPLVVDWTSDQRGDLEVAMRDGIAVVSYSCEAIRLLGDCKITGTYGFIGMTQREQVVRLENADEVRANLPLSGASLGGEISRGSKVDIAMITIGKRRTTWTEPSKEDLVGSCEGATHYVRGATVGAFVVEMGTQAKARAAAELFGAGVASGSDSKKETRQQEGKPSDCAASKPDAMEPPAQCGASIRIALAPILAAKRDPAATAPAAATVDPTCPAGLVFADGKCTAAAATAAHQCPPRDQADCVTQCDKGHAGSCAELGRMYVRGDGVGRDAAKAKPLLEKACSSDEASACLELGLLGDGDVAALFAKACDAGIAGGCEQLGRTKLKDDPAAAVALLRKGCDGGEDTSCAGAAQLLAEGSGDVVPKNVEEAKALHERACHGTVAKSCSALGALVEKDAGGAIRAEPLYRRGCFSGDGNACFDLGRLEVVRNPESAKRSFGMGCARNALLACAGLAVVFGEKRGAILGVAEKLQAQTKCNEGSASQCTIAGILDLAAGQPQGKLAIERACRAGDAFACEVQKRSK